MNGSREGCREILLSSYAGAPEHTVCAWLMPDDGLQEARVNFRKDDGEEVMAVVAKKKKPAAKKKASVGMAEIALAEYEALVEDRYAWALSVKQDQDEATEAALNRAVVRMLAMAGPPIFKYKGISVAADEERLKSIQVKSLTWFAVRMFAACAEWDIRIANFKPPKKACAKCGKKVKVK